MTWIHNDVISRHRGMHRRLRSLAFGRRGVMAGRRRMGGRSVKDSEFSRRILDTDEPCVVGMQRMLRTIEPPPMSLAQGIVHWEPPPRAVAAARAALDRGGAGAHGCAGIRARSHTSRVLPFLARSLSTSERISLSLSLSPSAGTRDETGTAPTTASPSYVPRSSRSCATRMASSRRTRVARRSW